MERNEFVAKFAGFRLFLTLGVMISVLVLGCSEITELTNYFCMLFLLMLLFVSLGNTHPAFLALVVLPGAPDSMHFELASFDILTADIAMLGLFCFSHLCLH